MGRHDDNSSTSSESYKRERKLKKHKKSKRKKRQRYSDDESSSSSDDEDRRHRRRRKERKHKDKTKRKKDKRSKRSRDEDNQGSLGLERNVLLTDALCQLFNSHPDLVDDLPIMLIRLGGGATFDLSQMTNRHASASLEAVFGALQPFGVGQDSAGAWIWTGPTNDMVLIRVVRAMLDQLGFTGEAVEAFESNVAMETEQKLRRLTDDTSLEMSKRLAQDLLRAFRGQGQLTKELSSLCNMILEGESIALDDLPDEKLRIGLERLFQSCNLEMSEMDNNDDDEKASSRNQGAAMGYALPDADIQIAKSMLQAVIAVCQAEDLANSQGRRAIAGPMLRPEDYTGQAYQVPAAESDDDVGPAPFRAHENDASVDAESIKAATEKRARDLVYAKTGVMPPSEHDDTVREEWMVDPGKFDFLSNIKSGQPMRNRGFQAAGAIADKSGPAVARRKDPRVQAEIDAIMQAHQESRGPSLMELHRDKKAQDAAQASSDNKGADNWKWDRETDLSAGRKVDKANLNMVLGGAGTDLKQKFHKGS